MQKILISLLYHSLRIFRDLLNKSAEYTFDKSIEIRVPRTGLYSDFINEIQASLRKEIVYTFSQKKLVQDQVNPIRKYVFALGDINLDASLEFPISKDQNFHVVRMFLNFRARPADFKEDVFWQDIFKTLEKYAPFEKPFKILDVSTTRALPLFPSPTLFELQRKDKITIHHVDIVIKTPLNFSYMEERLLHGLQYRLSKIPKKETKGKDFFGKLIVKPAEIPGLCGYSKTGKQFSHNVTKNSMDALKDLNTDREWSTVFMENKKLYTRETKDKLVHVVYVKHKNSGKLKNVEITFNPVLMHEIYRYYIRKPVDFFVTYNKMFKNKKQPESVLKFLKNFCPRVYGMAKKDKYNFYVSVRELCQEIGLLKELEEHRIDRLEKYLKKSFLAGVKFGYLQAWKIQGYKPGDRVSLKFNPQSILNKKW